jgi:hypothetical protein
VNLAILDVDRILGRTRCPNGHGVGGAGREVPGAATLREDGHADRHASDDGDRPSHAD